MGALSQLITWILIISAFWVTMITVHYLHKTTPQKLYVTRTLFRINVIFNNCFPQFAIKWEVWQWCLIRTWQSSATKRCHGDNFKEKLQQVETRCQNIKNMQTKIKGHQMDDYLSWLKISAVYTICTSFFFIWVSVIIKQSKYNFFLFLSWSVLKNILALSTCHVNLPHSSSWGS